MSDTTGYIAYDYIINCCRRYESAHPTSNVNQLLQEMVDVVGIDINSVESNKENSGGGQYIIKNTTSENWYKIYDDSNKLYKYISSYMDKKLYICTKRKNNVLLDY